MACPHCGEGHLNRLLCKECSKPLTWGEAHYYDGLCEACERAEHDRIKAWRAGADDAELDAKFSDIKTEH